MQCSMCRYLGDNLGSLARSRHHHHCHRSGREPRHIVISSVISTSSYHPSYPSLRNYFDCQINVTLIIWPELQPPTTTRRGISCQTMFVCSLHSKVKDGRRVSFPFPFVFVCSHGGGGGGVSTCTCVLCTLLSPALSHLHQLRRGVVKYVHTI